MSHELRTPLNSMLILSKMLGENPDNALSDKQVEFANTIHSSGADLLALINEILDLSKIESGAMAVEIADVTFTDLRADIKRMFSQVAEDKGLDLVIELQQDLPERIQTDVKRLRQVLKNLLSNAFKFTEFGEVNVQVASPTSGWSPDNQTLNKASSVIAFSVADTGIGIPEDKQQLIFEAFQQADGTTSRKYGGTGLGLSISREICRLLGGEIAVESAPGRGSRFTLYLPIAYDFGARNGDIPHFARTSSPYPQTPPRNEECPHFSQVVVGREATPLLVPAEITDDRQNIQPGEAVLLIIEDDAKFGRILLDLAHDRGFKAVVSATGGGALPLVRRFNPALITLDINLPDMDGWRLLDILKRGPDTRHIPIHIISVEDPRERGLQMGAFSVLEKPVDHATLQQALARTEEFIARPVKELLLVEDDELQCAEILKVIGNGDAVTTQVRTGEHALQLLRERAFDCAVLDLVLPDMDGLQLVETIRRDNSRRLPIIIHTAKDVSSAEEAKLRNLVESFILKGPESHQQLFDETALFMHRNVAGMSEDKRRIIDLARRREAGLAGRRVLIVDDDIRNIFSLTGVLEQHQVQVVHAESGRRGIEQLEATPNVDMVLMDVMMPDMDGYETMRQIRSVEAFRKLPIVAITAKAMKGDREKCIAAGATEYISKPVDTDQLVSMMRVWLGRV
jgi:CheY-like chemotaxis protein